MRNFLVHSARFIGLVLAQVLIFNQLEIGLGIHPMVYPLFIVLLPFETGPILLLFLAFAMGISIDAMSNTYGLHTSALLLVAYLRPIIFNAYSPRDGYDSLKEGTIYEMGQRWFLYTFGTLILIHHFWFFLIEVFKFTELSYVFYKLLVSAPVTYIFCVLLQFIFLKRTKTA